MTELNQDGTMASVNKPWHKPLDNYNTILPNLFMGGTHDDDMFSQHEKPLITTDDFDSVYTLFGWANPSDWNVKEVRLPFYDSGSFSVDESELYEFAEQAHKDWKRGKRVLIRCQAGLNRSGLITALLLIKEGYSPADAIDLIRSSRSEYCLMNPFFEKWLLTQPHELQWS